MNPERWARIEEVFHRAAECDPKRRASLLDEVCNGDDELRREVEVLLAGEEGARDDMRAAVHSGLEAATFPLVGEAVSHYRILDGLGSGGMGLLYRAEDIKLGRQVALKFLLEESAKDPAALGRFEREARSASALEHPNICPIYEFGEHEGRPFIVMQLLEGRTLRELISAAEPGKPPFTLDELLDIADQISEGLEAAHRHGIIHRDVKPANIFVTTQGQVKILDFGLAKLSPREIAEEESELTAPESQEKKEETLTTHNPLLSRTGVAMGTAGYMSPEQVRGEKLDTRTDLFSLGLVLYEMPTGQRAFKGDTGPVLRDAILKQTAPSLFQLNSKFPAKLEKIISRALQKDRDARYQSAAEIRAELKRLKHQSEHRSRWREVVAGSVVLLLLIAVFWVYGRRQRLSQTLLQPKLTQLTVNSFENRVTTGAISPHGKYLAYADMNGMYIKHVDTGEVRPVPLPEGLDSKSVSWEIPSAGWLPDGARFIVTAHPANVEESAWSSQNSSIWMVSALGGAPYKLRDKAVAWSVSRDGSISFGNNNGRLGEREIWLMAPNGEQAHKLFETDENSSIAGLLWSPNGQRVMYIRTDESGVSLVSRDLTGGPLTTIFSSSETKRMNGGVWLSDGRLLYSLEEPGSYFGRICDFWTMPIDLQTGRPTGKPRQLTNWGASCMDAMSVTADRKRIAFLKWEGHDTGYMAELTAGGAQIHNLRHFPLSESSESVADWTPDSRTMIVVSNRSGTFGLYKQPLDSDLPDGPLVNPPDGTRNVRVTPDGQSILYFGGGKTGGPPAREPEPAMRAPINGGPSQQLFIAATWSLLVCGSFRSAGCAIAEPSEDRKQLMISSLHPLTGRGPELTRLALDPNEDRWFLDLSADGSRFAFTRTPSDPIQILSVQGRPIQQIRVKGWSNLLEFSWAMDGKGLYVVAGTRGGHVLLYVDLQGNAHRLWESPGASGETYVRPSPDGRHLAIQSWTTKGNMWMMENF